ncbi:hypothetical protein [Roseimaritima ulvae]|uniref:Uncharacterized protein n=1 Tax=Roseimaritima ulvae TaxID=980254 RepID=A0A5B9QXS4_9BACT|nr:hypothetical protein [Roseimaritima ulvae]QEG38761.1 hypothetical protein UC8_07190 [Roseimaritima ulvae]
MLDLKKLACGLWAWTLLSCPAATAQFDAGLQPTAPAVKSWTVDPFMTEAQVQAIERWLQTPCPFDWGPGTTLQMLKRDLATKVPTRIDHQSLDEIGIDQDVVLVPGKRPAAPRPRPAAGDPFAAADAVDPFANSQASEPSSFAAPKLAAPKLAASEKPWWRRPSASRNALSRGATAASPPSVGARMLSLLDGLDLTIIIRGGQLILTTQEKAEEQLCNRVYDVTALLDAQRADPRLLMQTLESAVEPATWEALGGPSTMSILPARQRQWLVISAPTTVHWQVQALLDRLHR